MEGELARGLEEKQGNQLESPWGIQVKDNLEGSSCEPSQLYPSVCPAAHSFPHTTPASLAAFLFQESLVIVLSTPGPRLLFPAPAPPASPHASQDKAVSWARLRATLRTFPTASTFLHPTLRAHRQAAGTLEGKEESGHHPDDGGQCGKRAGLPSPTWQSLVNRNRAWWGWLLPESHTRLSVIKAISHLRTGELQAGAAAAGNASGLVLGGRVGTSGQKLEGVEDQRLPSVWPGRKGVWGLRNHSVPLAVPGASSTNSVSFLFSMGTESLRLVKHPQR